MRSKDRKTNCPVCNAIVSADNLKNHIGQMIRREKISGNQITKKHCNYKDFGSEDKLGQINGVDSDEQRDNLEDR